MRKRAGRIIAFLLLFVFLFVTVQAVLTPKWRADSGGSEDETDKYGFFYELPKNTVDYFTMGASTSCYSISPSRIYAETGITGYCLGNDGQRIDILYYLLKEALKTQHPKMVFLDMSLLMKEETIDACLTRAFVQMKPSFNKLQAAQNCKTETRTAMELLFPLIQFHDRWKDLTKKDFYFGAAQDYVRNGAFEDFHVVMDTKILERPSGSLYKLENEEITAVEERTEKINESEADYFEKVLSLCQANGIELIPTHFGEIWPLGRSETIESYLKPFGLELLDLTDPAVGLDWMQDSRDNGTHTNFWGCAKESVYLADILRTKGFEDHRGQSGYELWDRTLETYRQWEQEELRTKESKNAYEYLNALASVKDEYLIVLTVLDEASGAWNDTLEAALRRLGVKSSFYDQIQNSFVAILDRGKNLFELWDGREIEVDTSFRTTDGKEHSLYVASAGFVYGNVCPVKIDGADQACWKRGLNIVVIDPDSGKAVSSVAIDSHIEELTFVTKALPEEQTAKWTQSTEDFQLVENGVYNILFAGGPAFAVDIPDGSGEENANIWLCGRNGEPPQKFEIRYTGDGLYTIRAVCSDKYIAIENMGSTPGSNVVQETYTGLANQKWFITENLNGSYSFTSLYNGCVLDVVDGVAASGTNIQVWTENGQIPQQFYLELAG